MHFEIHLDRVVSIDHRIERIGGVKSWEFEDRRAAVRARFASMVGACTCVCSAGECPPLLGFGWDFLVNPSFTLVPLCSPELFAAVVSSVQRGGSETRRKRGSVEVYEREWMTRRTREIDIRNPCAVGHRALLLPPHAQWRSKRGQLD